jgi:hypothetical protein
MPCAVILRIKNLSNLLPVTSQSGANRNSFVLATNVVHH